MIPWSMPISYDINMVKTFKNRGVRLTLIFQGPEDVAPSSVRNVVTKAHKLLGLIERDLKKRKKT